MFSLLCYSALAAMRVVVGTLQKAFMAAIIVIRHCVEVFCVSLAQEYLSFGVLPKNRNIGNSYKLYVLFVLACGTYLVRD